MEYLHWIIAAIVAALILLNYSKDRGFHPVAKPVHLICMASLTWYYSAFVGAMFNTLGHLEVILNGGLEGSVLLPGFLYTLAFFLRYGLVLTLLVLIALMTARQEKGRRAFLWVLPTLTMLEVIFHIDQWILIRTLLLTVNDSEFLVRIVVVAAVAMAITLAYGTRFMQDFFKAGPDTSKVDGPSGPQPFDFRQ